MKRNKVGRPKGEPTERYSIRYKKAIIDRLKKKHGRNLQTMLQNELMRIDEEDGN